MHERFSRTVLAAGTFCLAATAVSAQTLGLAPQRPTSGLFGTAPRGDQIFDISASLVGAYVDNVVPLTGGGSLDGNFEEGGSYNGVTTGVTYGKQFRRVSIGASGGSALRHYPAASDMVGMHYIGGVGVAVQLDKTRITATQRLRRSPYYSIANTPQLFEPELASLPAMSFDTAVIRRESRSYGSSANLTQSLGQRMVLAFAASLDSTELLNESAGLRQESALGRLTYGLSRDFGLVLGYRYQKGTYQMPAGPALATKLNTIDIGIDYHHALSVSRKTTIAFTTGTVVAQDFAGQTQYRVVGTGRLNRAIGRTWHATGAYNRGVEFIEGFSGPFFADTAAVDVGGSLNRRVDVSLNGAYSFGQFGFAESDGDTVSYNGTARVRAALSRVTALFAEYHIYRYSFDRSVPLPVGLYQQLDRQGVRFGLDLWFPLIRR